VTSVILPELGCDAGVVAAAWIRVNKNFTRVKFMPIGA